jgi:hypothetical protein
MRDIRGFLHIDLDELFSMAGASTPLWATKLKQ